MSNPRFDLSPLDPEADPAWKERVSEAIMVRVKNVGARTPAIFALTYANDSIAELLSLARPALIAASVIAAIAMFESERRSRPVTSTGVHVQAPAEERRFPVASAVGLAGPWARWVEEGRSPSAGEVLAAARGY